MFRFNVYTCNAADSAECVPNPRCRNAANARHGVCPMGMEDIAVNLRRSHSLFYNKALPEFDFGAIQCNYNTIKRIKKLIYITNINTHQKFS
jgi:hypothetical protein